MADQEQNTQQIEHSADAMDGFPDEHGISLASKVLSGIALMAVGIFLGLWLGPKIAPALPAGMAPLAAWLAPGGQVNEEALAELRAEFEAQINALPAPVSAGEVAAMLPDTTTDLRTRLDALDDQMAAADTSGLEGRIASLEFKVNGLRVELSSLLTRIADVSAEGGATSSETAAQIAAYASMMDGLKAEIEALAEQNGALSQKIDGVSIAANRQVAAAETMVNEVTQTAAAERNTTTIRTSLQAIEIALDAGLPFAAALNEYKNAGGGTVPVALADASGGIATMGGLRADFPEAAHAAIRASILASAGDGILSGTGAFLRAQLASRSLTPQVGLAPDAVLSRAEDALKRDDLTEALREIGQLPATSIEASGDGAMALWVDAAATRLDAVNAFQSLISTVQP